MRTLVTGGGGFVGSNLALELESLGHEVVVIDRFTTGHRDNLRGFKGQTLQGSVADALPAEILNSRFDAIFHQAAITDPRHPNDAETLRLNLAGSANILAVAQRMSAKLIYASTASLYGNGPSAQREDQPKELLSAYATSKLIQDEMFSHHWRHMHIVGLRYFNVFGPREHHKGRAASMILHLARQMCGGNRPRIFKDGEQKRDHVYVKDCVGANLAALNAPSGVYNVGTGVATSFNEVIAYLNEALGTNLPPDYIDNPYAGSYQNYTQADMTRANSLMKFTPRFTTRGGVKDYVTWLLHEKLV